MAPIAYETLSIAFEKLTQSLSGESLHWQSLEWDPCGWYITRNIGSAVKSRIEEICEVHCFVLIKLKRATAKLCEFPISMLRWSVCVRFCYQGPLYYPQRIWCRAESDWCANYVFCKLLSALMKLYSVRSGSRLGSDRTTWNAHPNSLLMIWPNTALHEDSLASIIPRRRHGICTNVCSSCSITQVGPMHRGPVPRVKCLHTGVGFPIYYDFGCAITAW